jgi:hypothetical protein
VLDRVVVGLWSVGIVSPVLLMRQKSYLNAYGLRLMNADMDGAGRKQLLGV